MKTIKYKLFNFFIFQNELYNEIHKMNLVINI